MNIPSPAKRPLNIIILLLTVALLLSCSTTVKQERSTGKTNEILVVTNSKDQWNGELGKVVKDFFEQPLAGFIQRSACPCIALVDDVLQGGSEGKVIGPGRKKASTV